MAPIGKLHVGTAGWQLPKGFEQHPAEGTHLQRYARHFNAAEINTTFYRPHRIETFQRWADSVPEEFRFAVKLHKDITHGKHLKEVTPVQPFLAMVEALGQKLGPVLVQLPPSLPYSMEAAEFLSALREVYNGPVVLEARHPSWSEREAKETLIEHAISGVAADPPLIRDAVQPWGYPDLAYFRLHGSPQVYWSSYTDDFLQALARQVSESLRVGREVWVIFDNTGAGAGAPDAARLKAYLQKL